jgi:protoporphyrinogen oxidase
VESDTGKGRSELRISYDAIVIGAGPAGLTAAWKLAEAGQRVVVLEASDAVGGLARSLEVFGARVDVGPHRFFSSDRRINEAWLDAVDGDYVMVDRTTRILYDGKLFDYPLKPANALKNLGVAESIRSIGSYAKAQVCPPEDTSSFEGWVTSRFGARLYEIFFKTYSERLWGIPCTELDADFAAQRIKNFSLGAALKSAIRPSSGAGHKTLADRFAYPMTGAGLVYEKMAERLQNAGGEIEFRTPVERVLLSGADVKGVQLVSGDLLFAPHVISTMPLTSMVRTLPAVPDHVVAACEALRYRNTTLVFLEVSGPSTFPDQWIYIHDPRVRMGRLTNFSNWSRDVGGDRSQTILCAEYWSNDEDSFWTHDDETLGQIAVNDVRLTGLIGSAAVRQTSVRKLHRCYPVYERGYRDHVQTIREFLETISGLHAIGRYGSFKYNNQDHSILMGLLVVDNIVRGTSHDLWAVNTDYDDYQESARIDESGVVTD